MRAGARSARQFGMRDGRRSAPEDKVEFGIVAPVAPQRAALALLQGNSVPGCRVGIFIPSYRVCAPELFARLRVVRRQETASARIWRRTSRNAGDHLSADHQWAGGIVEADVVVGNLYVPQDLAGTRVQGDEAGVSGCKEDSVVIKSNAVSRSDELPLYIAAL